MVEFVILFLLIFENWINWVEVDLRVFFVNLNCVFNFFMVFFVVLKFVGSLVVRVLVMFVIFLRVELVVLVFVIMIFMFLLILRNVLSDCWLKLINFCDNFFSWLLNFMRRLVFKRLFVFFKEVLEFVELDVNFFILFWRLL